MFAGEMPIFLGFFLASTSAAAAPRRAARSAAAPRRNRPLHTAGPSSWGRPSANPSAVSPAALWYSRLGISTVMGPFMNYNL